MQVLWPHGNNLKTRFKSLRNALICVKSELTQYR